MDERTQKHAGPLWILILAMVLLGCAPTAVRQTPPENCPPAQTLNQAIQTASQNSQAIPGIRSRGKLIIRLIENGKETRKESLDDITLRFWNKDEGYLYLRANSLVGEVLRMGMNPAEFWHRKTIADDIEYIWGSRERLDQCAGQISFQLAAILEMLGVFEFDQNYTLSQTDYRDVLTVQNEFGLNRKKIWIDRCDRLVRRVEYFDRYGAMTLSFDLQNYQPLEQGPKVPTKIISFQKIDSASAAEIQIELKAIKQFVPSQKQLEKGLFERPRPDRADRIYQLNSDCRFEQKK